MLLPASGNQFEFAVYLCPLRSIRVTAYCWASVDLPAFFVPEKVRGSTIVSASCQAPIEFAAFCVPESILENAIFILPSSGHPLTVLQYVYPRQVLGCLFATFCCRAPTEFATFILISPVLYMKTLITDTV